jgi:N-acetylglucosamine malate deacetylase 1
LNIDVIAFAPHPDDAELYCSGTLLAFKQAGYSTGIVDLTRGELSTRGTPELRKKETETASAILKLDLRVNLDIPDGNIEDNAINRWKIAKTIREHTPRIVFLPYHSDRHPDHEHASRLVRDALFYSGVAKWDPDGSALHAHRPGKAFYYQLADDFAPSVLLDVSDHFETKMAAIGAYASQFYSDDSTSGNAETYISSKGFMESLIGRSKRLGFLAGGSHAEGFIHLDALRMKASDLMRI